MGQSMSKNNTKLDTPMLEKVEITQPEQEGMLSMIIGTVLVALGILLLVVGIVMFVLYYLPPREDRNVSKPVLFELPVYTNTAKLVLKGESETDKVMVWVNDELVNGTLKVEDKKFELEYPISTEGIYKVEVSALKGFPVRLRSEKTSPVIVNIDWSAPSKNVSFKYEKEVDRKVVTIKGKGEANTVITLKRNDKEYSAKTDDNGNFEIKNIPLVEGGNAFSAVVKDLAGNSTRIDTTIRVIYASGDINGGGATDLPESAGLLSNEMAYKLGNTLLTFFGITSLMVLGINMYAVKRKLNS
jgi:hypothetical protein